MLGMSTIKMQEKLSESTVSGGHTFVKFLLQKYDDILNALTVHICVVKYAIKQKLIYVYWSMGIIRNLKHCIHKKDRVQCQTTGANVY